MKKGTWYSGEKQKEGEKRLKKTRARARQQSDRGVIHTKVSDAVRI